MHHHCARVDRGRRSSRDACQLHAQVFCEALCTLWTEHVPVHWDAYYAEQPYVRVPVLPTYSFERVTHWSNPAASMYVPSSAEAVQAAQQLIDAADERRVAPKRVDPLLVRLRPAAAERR